MLPIVHFSEGKGDDRGRDGWMASPIQCIWVWASSGSGWWTGKPGVLQSMGLQRVGHDWATELNILQTESLQTTEMYCLAVLEAVSSKSRCHKTVLSEETWAGMPSFLSWLLMFVDNPWVLWLVEAPLQSLYPLPHGIPASPRVSLPFLQGHLSCRIGTHP